MIELTAWHWFALTCILLILEITVPVAFFLWLAAAALVSTIVAYFLPDLSWQIELTIFSIVAILSLVVWAKSPKKEGRNRSTRAQRAKQSVPWCYGNGV